MTQLLSADFQTGESALKKKNSSESGCIGVGIISYNATSIKKKHIQLNILLKMQSLRNWTTVDTSVPRLISLSPTRLCQSSRYRETIPTYSVPSASAGKRTVSSLDAAADHL